VWKLRAKSPSQATATSGASRQTRFNHKTGPARRARHGGRGLAFLPGETAC
jgi:hypothetical protein